MKRNWRTTLLGIIAMILGAWSFWVHWIPSQTLYFNLIYAEIPSIGLMFSGWIGLHSADYKNLK